MIRKRLHYNFSFWDSVIVSAAITSNCSYLYSEDMQNKMVIDGMTIYNPFSAL